MTDQTQDDGLQELLLPEERKGYRYDRETKRIAAGLSYQRARELLHGVVRFSDETDYDAVLLFAAASRIVERLDLVWYLSFTGPKSSGKTTAARVARFLSHHIIEAGQITGAGLPRAMAIANGVLLDEVDVLLRREGNDLIAAMLRQGTDRQTPVLRLDETGRGKEWKLTPVRVYGPKLLTFKRTIDDALASRSDRIHMPRARDPKIRRASTRFRRTLLPLKAWLDREARRVLNEWSKGEVDSFLDSPEFTAMSDGLRTEIDRTGQIGDLMLLVGHLYGWPTRRVVQVRLGVIEEATVDDEVEEVRRAVVALYEDRPSVRTVDGANAKPETVVLKKSAIKARVDLERKANSQKPIWINRVAEALDDLGFEHDERFSKTDREKAVRVGPEQVARITQPLASSVGTEGSEPEPPSGTGGGPHSGPALPKGGAKCGPQTQTRLGVPHRDGGVQTAGPGGGQGRSADGGSPSNPAVPAVPAPLESQGPNDADPEDLFEGRTTRADRARRALGRDP